MLVFSRIMRSTRSQHKFSARSEVSRAAKHSWLPETIVRSSRLQVNLSFNTAVW
jgi:hypothetical protein